MRREYMREASHNKDATEHRQDNCAYGRAMATKDGMRRRVASVPNTIRNSSTAPTGATFSVLKPISKIRWPHDGTYEPSQSSKSSTLQAPGKVDAAAPSKHFLQRRSPSSSVLEKLKTSHGPRVETPSVNPGMIVSKVLWLR